MTEKKVTGLNTAAIMALSLIGMGFTVVTPAMAIFAEHYAGKDTTWISTLPTLFIVIGTVTAGAVMGKVIKYRTLAIIACLLYVVGGCAPGMFDNYAGMLVCRAIFGLGAGLMSPLGTALVILTYKDQKRAKILGYRTLFSNGGGIIMQMLGGALAVISWQYVFWGHAFGLIGLAMAFFLPEPEISQAAQEKTKEARPKKKEKMNKVVWLIAAILIIFNVLNYPVMLNISSLFVQRDAGNAAVAATALSMYTVAGCVAGFVFGFIFKHLQRWVIAIGFFLCALGAFLIYSGQTTIVMTLGMALIGFGFSTILPASFSWVGKATPPSTVATATSICVAATNLGGFVSSFWLKFLNAVFGENMLSGLTIEIIVLVIIGVVFLAYDPYKDRKTAAA